MYIFLGSDEMKINLPEFISNLFNNLSPTDQSLSNNLNNKGRVQSHLHVSSSQETTANTEQIVVPTETIDVTGYTVPVKSHNGFKSLNEHGHSCNGKNVWDVMQLFSPSPKPSLTIDLFPSPCSSLSPIFGSQTVHSNSWRNDISSGSGSVVIQVPETVQSHTYQCQRNPSILATPMVLSSLNSLNSGQTPADAFPDILQLIEQDCVGLEDAAKTKTCSDMMKADTSQLQINTNSSCATALAISHVGDLDLVEMLISVADQIESEKTQPRKKFTYTRQEDKLRSRESGLKKCQHAKRMTDEENNYWKKVKRESRLGKGEKKKETLQPKGVRKSMRSKKLIRYF